MSRIRIAPTDALIVVDVQPTFMPGGGLAVAGGDGIVRDVLALMYACYEAGAPAFATLDRHPRGHVSLASSYIDVEPMTVLTLDLLHGYEGRIAKGGGFIAPHAKFGLDELRTYLETVGSQVLWPDHAIEGTEEAGLHPAFRIDDFDAVQVKGMDPVCDSYSGFYDNLRRPTGFGDVVEVSGAERIFVCGLAFDFCVGWTALDAGEALHDRGIHVIEDACRSVNAPGTIQGMKDRLRKAGVGLVSVSDLLDA